MLHAGRQQVDEELPHGSSGQVQAHTLEGRRGPARRRQSISGERWERHNKGAWGFGMLVAGLKLL